MITSVIPVIRQMSSTRFFSMQFHSYGTGFTLSNIRYMLIGQYAIVMFVVIVSVCISRQIGLIRTMQVGGKERTILVMREQPASVIRRYGLLKTDLAKHPEIRRVTSAMQLPGSAIRDGVYVRTDQESEDEGRRIPVLVVGEDFIPFFGIRLLSGTSFSKGLRTLEEEEQMLFDSIDGKPAPDITEEYVINRKAAEILGFNTPNEAVGQRLHIRHGQGGVDYINKGMIVGVTIRRLMTMLSLNCCCNAPSFNIALWSISHPMIQKKLSAHLTVYGRKSTRNIRHSTPSCTMCTTASTITNCMQSNLPISFRHCVCWWPHWD